MAREPNEITDEEFGQLLRDALWRNRKEPVDLIRAKVAKQAAVYRWVKGERQPQAHHLRRLVWFLDAPELGFPDTMAKIKLQHQRESIALLRMIVRETAGEPLPDVVKRHLPGLTLSEAERQELEEATRLLREKPGEVEAVVDRLLGPDEGQIDL